MEGKTKLTQCEKIIRHLREYGSISSLEAMAYGMKYANGIVCPVINARRTQYYSALFRGADGNVTRLTEDAIVLGADLDSTLAPYDAPIYLTGDGYESARGFITHPKLMLTPELYRWPGAFAVADCAAHIWENASPDTVFTPDELTPVYLRKTQAEREREEMAIRQQYAYRKRNIELESLSY